MQSPLLVTTLFWLLPAVLTGLGVYLWRRRSARAGMDLVASILDEIGDGVFLADPRGQLMYMNRAARRDLGLEDVSLPAPLLPALRRREDLVAMLTGETSAVGERRQLDLVDDVSLRSYDVDTNEMRDSQGALAGRLLVLRDVTDERRSAEQLDLSEKGLRQLIDVFPHLIYARDRDGVFLLANQAGAASYGLKPEELVGRTIFDVGLSPRLVEKMRKADREVIDTGRQRSSQDRYTANGQESVLQTTKIPFRLPGSGKPAVLSLSIDVTEQTRAEERIRTLAFYDSLTGLPNRPRFQHLLGRSLERARDRGGKLALLFLDLDRFKEVNDRLGHSTGDHLLRDVAERLRDCVRMTDGLTHSEPPSSAGSSGLPDSSASSHAPSPSNASGSPDSSSHSDLEVVADATPVELGTEARDSYPQTVSRLAGDEFTILLTDVPEPANAAQVATRIIDALSRPFYAGSHEVFITASIGIALYPEDGLGPDALLGCADQAMYQAKRAGSNRYAFFDPSMNAAAARRHDIETQLRHAVENDELRLVYQQIRNALTGEISGVEALLRWESAELGSVAPDEFIPVAEETGLIGGLGDWVLREACRQREQWRMEGLMPPRVAINVSAVQLQLPEFAEQAGRIIREAGVSLDEIEFELTETAILAHDRQTDETLRRLADMGVRLSLDDFGTGQSSLSYLRRFAFSRIKIDRSFVAEIPGNREDANLTQAIIAMAHGLGLSVVAEGVENEEQLRFLRDHECDELQGFLFAPPETPAEFAAHLERDKPSDPDAGS